MHQVTIVNVYSLISIIYVSLGWLWYTMVNCSVHRYTLVMVGIIGKIDRGIEYSCWTVFKVTLILCSD